MIWKSNPNLFVGIAGSIFTVFLAFSLINGKLFDFNLNIPFSFHGDGIYGQMFVTRLSEGWWFDNERQGFPFGSNHLSFPTSENTIFVLLKLFLTLGFSTTVSMNLLILTGFAVTFFITYLVLQSFKINRALSFTGGLLYSFTGYHVHHLMHFTYAPYFIIPIYFWVAFQISSIEKQSKLIRNKPLLFILLIVSSGFAIYYTIFACIMISGSAVFFVSRERYRSQLRDYGFVLFSICTGFLLNFMPSVWFYLFNRSEDFASPIVRSRSDADVFSFRIAQLLLPSKDHIIPIVRNAVGEFNSGIPWAIHTYPSSLGLFASIGLIILFLILFKQPGSSKINLEQSYFARVTWLMVLVGTIGGFGPILSYLGFEQIRHWQRISVFIAFPCIAALCFVIQNMIERFSKRLQKLTCIALAVLGVLDQVGGSVPFLKKEDAHEYSSSSVFVDQIENSLPSGSAIYNLPYVEYPETIAPGTMQTYDQGLGLIGSKSLKWSYGTLKGSVGDNFWKSLSREEFRIQLRVITRLGFAGVYVDLRGYEDDGKQVLEELFESGLEGQKMRSDGNAVFFRISSFFPIPDSSLSVAQIQKIACYQGAAGIPFIETC
jgi:phosphoglycerol transferase